MSFSRVMPILARSRLSASHLHSRLASTSRTSTNGPPNPHSNFYRTHGRALFKSLTMAFLSYQIFYWAWITLEAEDSKDEKRAIIKSLEEEARLLGSGVGSHRLLEEPEERNEIKK